MTRIALIAVIFAMTAISGVLHYATDQPVATFVVCALALAGLAWIVAVGTEAVGARFGPAVTGVLQSTLGNLPELFVVLFALSAGETVVAQTSILGSLEPGRWRELTADEVERLRAATRTRSARRG